MGISEESMETSWFSFRDLLDSERTTVDVWSDRPTLHPLPQELGEQEVQGGEIDRKLATPTSCWMIPNPSGPELGRGRDSETLGQALLIMEEAVFVTFRALLECFMGLGM